jgi:hypothetical protein
MVVESEKKGGVPTPTKDALHSMTPSLKGVNLIVDFEVSEESYYGKKLSKPTWPGGQSGVTIGIGYDVGYNSASQVEHDWGGRIPDAFVQDLKGVAGLKGPQARNAAERLAGAGIKVPWEAANAVFNENTLAAMRRQLSRRIRGSIDFPTTLGPESFRWFTIVGPARPVPAVAK